MSLHQKLLARAAEGRPIRLGLIGAGKFGTMFLSQARRLPGVHVVGIADLDPSRARGGLALAGWGEERFAPDLDQAAASGRTHLGEDAPALIAHPAIEIVIEATGDPLAAVDHLLAAFAAGKHTINATVEADALCGAALAARARAAGVIHSMAYGDQPAMVCALVDWARSCGFQVVAAGRGHKWRPEYRFSTPETVWQHWGLSAQEAARGRLNPKMFNSFLDGSKPAIESAAIANACGLDAPEQGLAYPSGAIRDLPRLMRPRAEGGILARPGMVEVVNSLDPDGRPIPNDIRMGVWVVAMAGDDYQARCLGEYKVATDPSGRYFAAFQRWHLIGLELGMSVAHVALRGEATGTATAFRADVVAVAKRDLTPGEILDGEGGRSVAGQLRPAAQSVAMGALPLGLTAGARVTRPVRADSILTWADVAPDDSRAAFRLRRETEALLPG
ncbi:MAG: flagellar protein FlgA [Paracoccaceae bacterium]|nr:MAG: flagellar protein FlgA [Paracoccaceae bacterium]